MKLYHALQRKIFDIIQCDNKTLLPIAHFIIELPGITCVCALPFTQTSVYFIIGISNSCIHTLFIAYKWKQKRGSILGSVLRVTVCKTRRLENKIHIHGLYIYNNKIIIISPYIS